MTEIDVPNECKAIGHDPEVPPGPLVEQWHDLVKNGKPAVNAWKSGPYSLTDYKGKDGVTFETDTQGSGKDKILITLENQKGQQDFFDAKGTNPEKRTSVRWFDGDVTLTAKVDPVTGTLLEESGAVSDGKVASFTYKFAGDGTVSSCSTNDIAQKHEHILFPSLPAQKDGKPAPDEGKHEQLKPVPAQGEHPPGLPPLPKD